MTSLLNESYKGTPYTDEQANKVIHNTKTLNFPVMSIMLAIKVKEYFFENKTYTDHRIYHMDEQDEDWGYGNNDRRGMIQSDSEEDEAVNDYEIVARPSIALEQFAYEMAYKIPTFQQTRKPLPLKGCCCPGGRSEFAKCFIKEQALAHPIGECNITGRRKANQPYKDVQSYVRHINDVSKMDLDFIPDDEKVIWNRKINTELDIMHITSFLYVNLWVSKVVHICNIFLHTHWHNLNLEDIQRSYIDELIKYFPNNLIQYKGMYYYRTINDYKKFFMPRKN
jgi:hypothetical protein